MSRLLVIFALLIASLSGLAQSPVIQLDVNTKDEDSGKKLGGVTVEVYKNGQLFATKVSAGNGKVPLIDLPVGEGVEYNVFLKKSGYVTKMASIDAHFDYPEDLAPVVPFGFETSLFQKVDGVDFSFLETSPMIKMYIDDGGYQTWDKSHLKDMLNKIEELKKKIEEKKEEEEKKEADFQEYVKAGDNAVGKEEYETAITQYDLALGIKDDAGVQAKLEDAQKKLDARNANAAKEKEFGDKMAAAKKAFDAQNLTEALKLYKEAEKIKPDEKLPKERILEIEETIAKQKAQAEEFNKLVSQGDAAVGSELFDDAISKYEAALAIKSDAAVQTKLDNAKKAKEAKENAAAAAEKLEEDYNNLIADADKLFDTDKLEEAKVKYQEALKLKSGESHPTGRIKEIDAIIKKRLEEKNAAEKLEADYKKLIDNADALYDKKDWSNAKMTYEKALELKKNEKHPIDRISLIDKAIADEAANAAINEKYNTLMSEAKTLLDQKKYQEAINKYQEASGVKPAEAEPKTKIAEIQNILQNKEKAEKLEADYQNFMREGKELKGIKDYTPAIERFNKALELKPGDADATAQIKEINAIIEKEKAEAAKEAEFAEFIKKAEEKFNAKDYTAAKMNYKKALEIKNDPSIQPKIDAIDKLIAEESNEAETQAKYDAKMKEANALYASNDYKAALEKYEEASAIKPNEAEPKSKIGELKDKIATAEAKKATEEKFKSLVSEGDKAYTAKEYSKALEKYKEAIAVKPDPSISSKIAEINVLITEQNQNAEQNELYAKKMAQADAAFNDKSWETARDLYKSALNIKPNEQKPKDQIAQIEANMLAETEAETEKNYLKIIEKADLLLGEDKLDDAITYYQRALGFKPNDQYPKDKIKEIEEIKKERALAQQSEAQKEEAYKNLIKKADQDFNAQNYQAALASYKEAIGIKPDDTYPAGKVKEINGILASLDEQAKIDQDYKEKIDAADALFNSGEHQASIPLYRDAINIKPSEAYPVNQIAKAEEFMKKASTNEIEEQYQKILSVAQKKYDDKNYDGALDLYIRAKTMKPTDPIPQQRIDEINQIIAREADEKAKRKEYDALIKKADADFERKEWKTAKENYIAAINLIDEEYPRAQVAKITELMKSETTSEIEEQYQKIIAKADEYFNAENWEKARGLYERALGLKNYDPYPRNQLLEISKRLNPPEELTSGYTLKDYGPPNRNTNSVDVESLLEDSNEERADDARNYVLKQREEAEAADNINEEEQNEGIEKTENVIETFQYDNSVRVWSSEVKRTEYERDVEQIEVDLSERDRAWSNMNNNDIQHSKQALNNMETEWSANSYENDQNRVDYIGEVESINIELTTYNSLKKTEEESSTVEAREYVEGYMEDNVTNDPSLDIERKNTEVYVEDLNVTLINSTNENAWNHEDDVYEVKNQTEILTDEQATFHTGKDNERVESLVDVENLSDELRDYNNTNANDQYDATIETKLYTEDLQTEITANNIGNDQDRLDTEGEVVDFQEEIIVTNDHFKTEQNNVIYSTDANLDEIEMGISEDNKNRDKPRESYEVDVEDLNDEIVQNQSDLALNGLNASNETKDLADDLIDDQNNFKLEAEAKSNDVRDATTEAVDNMIQENADNLHENEVALEETSDFVEDLKYEKPSDFKTQGTNKLGDDFPEGITEEIFTIEDENGKIETYIIRRIVVKNGYGIVYEKTKTRYGTETYTKNGSGISETVWQDETEAAELVRN